jgi:putative phosphoribosyl transferase
MSDYIFSDRPDAGRQLAQRLLHLLSRNPVILALPRGGVPVAFEVAEALKAPLDLLFVRKIGAPGHPELGLGAVVDGAHPQVVLNEDVVSQLEIPATYIEREARNQLREIERRRERYLGGRPPINVTNRTAIVVDDGIATGGTIKAALGGLQRVRPAHLVLAVPVAPAETINQLRSQADEIVCLATPYPFHSVGAHYLNFNQTSDAEVVELLEAAQVLGRATA